MLDKIIDIITAILPFFGGRKKRQQMMQDVKEFSRTSERAVWLPYETARKGDQGLFRFERPCEGNALGDFFIKRQTFGSCHFTVCQ